MFDGNDGHMPIPRLSSTRRGHDRVHDEIDVIVIDDDVDLGFEREAEVIEVAAPYLDGMALRRMIPDADGGETGHVRRSRAFLTSSTLSARTRLLMSFMRWAPDGLTVYARAHKKGVGTV
jgi:hypothetical protein